MFKEIPLSQLAVGMFVESFGDGSYQHPLRHFRDYVHSRAFIEELQAQGLETVTVDLSRTRKDGRPAPRQASRAGSAPGAPSDEARRLYDRCQDHVSDVLRQVREGLDVDYVQSYEAVDALMRGIAENQANMVLLAKLQRFDDYTLRHSLNVSLLALIFGKYLDLPPERLRPLGFAGLFHDVGKFKIPLEILNKPGRLSEREFEVMKHHSRIGYELLKAHPGVTEDVLLGVLNHHERFDGRGYPHNLRGDEKDPFSRILTIVDIFDALTSDRSYKKAMTPHDSLKAMFSWRNESFHPGLLEKFVECFGVFPPGSFVRMTDQTCGMVVEARPLSPSRPLVKISFTRRLAPQLPVMVDLASTPKASEGGLDIEACLDPKDLGIILERFI